MGGEGSMAGAAASLKMNRALLRKRSFKDIRELYHNKSGGKTKIDFKEVSAEELQKIRLKIKAEAKKSAQKEIMVYAISFLVSIAIMYLVYLLFKS